MVHANVCRPARPFLYDHTQILYGARELLHHEWLEGAKKLLSRSVEDKNTAPVVEGGGVSSRAYCGTIL